MNQEISLMNLQEEKTKAEEEKNRAKIKDLQRKALRNKSLRTDIKNQNDELKEEIRNVTLMTKELVDRLNYPKAIIRNLLKVSSENRCQGVISTYCFTYWIFIEIEITSCVLFYIL